MTVMEDTMRKKKHHSLYEQVMQRLDTAFAKVTANRGAAGVDRESIAEFEAVEGR